MYLKKIKHFQKEIQLYLNLILFFVIIFQKFWNIFSHLQTNNPVIVANMITTRASGGFFY